MSDKPTLTAAEAGLEVAKAHRQFADRLEDYDPETARVIRTVTDRFEAALSSRLSEWVGLDEAQRHTGWSKSTLRQRCRDLEADGLARRDPHWEIRRDAIGDELPVKSGHERETIDLDDISGTARRLARSGEQVA